MTTAIEAVTVRRGDPVSGQAAEWLELTVPGRSARFRVTWVLLALALGLLAGLPAAGPAAAQGGAGGRAFRTYLPLVARTVALADLPPPTEGTKDPMAIEAGDTWVKYGEAVGNITDVFGNHPSMGDAMYLPERGEV